MVEGSLWVYGQTDLGAYYRGDLTLRQLYIRLISLPTEAPVMDVLRAEQDKAEANRRVSAVEATLSKFQRR